MKKINICLLLFLSAVMVFAGCAGSGGYLKTAPTSMSAASFFNNCNVVGLETFAHVGGDSSVINSQTDRVAYSAYTKNLYELLPQERCLISVLSYLCEINSMSSADQQKSKVKPFEYKNVLRAELDLLASTHEMAENYQNTKAVILLERADKTSSLEITAYLFYMDTLLNYEVAELQANAQNAHYTYTFVQTGHNVQTNTFSLKYATNCSASATYSAEKGSLNYTVKTYLGANKAEVEFNKSIYLYSNGTVGIRVITKNNTGNKSVIVYEQMETDFYKRLKVGAVKDEAGMISMETMPEDKLAKVNSSDDIGYAFEYDLRDDAVASRIICSPYGLSE